MTASAPAVPVLGIVLAAGAGVRMGGPKALVGPLAGAQSPVAVVAGRLHEAGCPSVVVVLGAAASAAAATLAEAEWLRVVVAEDWHDGMGASFRAGLTYAGQTAAEIALVTLVDLPDVGIPVFTRILDEVRRAGDDSQALLARAAYEGRPGHPVVLGRSWWPRAGAVATGDRGARELFATTPHRLIECADLATGVDVDAPLGTPDTHGGISWTP